MREFHFHVEPCPPRTPVGSWLGNDGKTALVSGTVEIDGKHLESGTMLFMPVDGQTPTAGGAIKNGRYSSACPLRR